MNDNKFLVVGNGVLSASARATLADGSSWKLEATMLNARRFMDLYNIAPLVGGDQQVFVAVRLAATEYNRKGRKVAAGPTVTTVCAPAMPQVVCNNSHLRCFEPSQVIPLNFGRLAVVADAASLVDEQWLGSVEFRWEEQGQ